SQPQLDMFDVTVATRADVTSLLTHVGDQFTMGRSQVLGRAVDCNGHLLVNVVVNIAPSTGANGSRRYEDGGRTYYATEDTDLHLYRRTERMETTIKGTFAASNLTAGHHFVQVWGYVSDAEVAMGSAGLALLGETEIIVTNVETWIHVPIYARAA